jgi:hypothetical protein
MAALNARNHGSAIAGISEASCISRKMYPARWPSLMSGRRQSAMEAGLLGRVYSGASVRPIFARRLHERGDAFSHRLAR